MPGISRKDDADPADSFFRYLAKIEIVSPPGDTDAPSLINNRLSLDQVGSMIAQPPHSQFTALFFVSGGGQDEIAAQVLTTLFQQEKHHGLDDAQGLTVQSASPPDFAVHHHS